MIHQIDVILWKDDTLNVWVAHGLQLDVAGQGGTVEEALLQTQCALASALIFAEKEGKSLIQVTGKYPKNYWKEFEQGRKYDFGSVEPVQIEPPLDVEIPALGEARVPAG